MSNFFGFVRVCSPCDTAQRCASFVEFSPSTHSRRYAVKTIPLLCVCIGVLHTG